MPLLRSKTGETLPAAELTITTKKKYRVHRNDTVGFTATMEIDGNALIEDFDGAVDEVLNRIRDMITAQLYVGE